MIQFPDFAVETVRHAHTVHALQTRSRLALVTSGFAAASTCTCPSGWLLALTLGLKVVHVFHLFWRQTSCDVFFVDWETSWGKVLQDGTKQDVPVGIWRSVFLRVCACVLRLITSHLCVPVCVFVCGDQAGANLSRQTSLSADCWGTRMVLGTKGAPWVRLLTHNTLTGCFEDCQSGTFVLCWSGPSSCITVSWCVLVRSVPEWLCCKWASCRADPCLPRLPRSPMSIGPPGWSSLPISGINCKTPPLSVWN